MGEVRLCAVDDVAVGAARRFDVDGNRLCVVRLPGDASSGDWYVIGDECSHADYSLSEGDVWAEEC
jgi:3-phenylpropionate/trans-cinnamate dioxygenase ferredoxin component